MQSYIHKVNYYETDKMGITHHSNYIRWMEEARIDFLEQIGQNYSKLEKLGVISPVIGVECNYKTPTTFDDSIEIDVKIRSFDGVKLIFDYVMKNQKDSKVVLTGCTRHCFTNKEGRPISLKKGFSELYQILYDLVENI